MTSRIEELTTLLVESKALTAKIECEIAAANLVTLEDYKKFAKIIKETGNYEIIRNADFSNIKVTSGALVSCGLFGVIICDAPEDIKQYIIDNLSKIKYSDSGVFWVDIIVVIAMRYPHLIDIVRYAVDKQYANPTKLFEFIEERGWKNESCCKKIYNYFVLECGLQYEGKLVKIE